MTCPATAVPFRCPSRDDIFAAALALLPQGRAWQSREGGPPAPLDPAFQADFVQDDALQTKRREGSMLWRFWRSVSDVFHFLHERLCALRLEFWCATQSETREHWMAEYGLPDPCDPFPDLCVKVAALGGTRCDYYAMLAARAGWAIECLDVNVRCRAARAGCARAGGPAVQVARLVIVVRLNESPAYIARKGRRPLAGLLRAGQSLDCPPPVLITSLKCLLERAVHAHLQIIYQAVA